MAAGASAQGVDSPFVLNDVVSMGISLNGVYVVTQDVYGNTYLINNSNEEVTSYEGYYPGNGNCISNEGVIVGQSMDERAAVMKNGEIITPAGMEEYNLSSINGVTFKGDKVCGWISNPGSTVAVPFVAELTSAGELGSPLRLPIPEKDFLGSTPQHVTATWISEDGSTVIGQVTDATGFYSYPIVFKESADGSWDYACPSEVLFNPEHLEIPSFPRGDGDDFGDRIDDYWNQMAKVVEGSSFVYGVGVLNPQGTLMANCLAVTNPESGMSDTYDEYKLCLFNLAEGTYKVVDSIYPNLIPMKILSDGTIVCLNLDSNCSFLVNAETAEVTPFASYIEATHPTWIPWMEENLGTSMVGTAEGDQEMLMSGYLWMSDNKEMITGGYIGYDTFSYVYGSLASEHVDFPAAQIAAPPAGVSSFSTLSVVWGYQEVELGPEENLTITITTPDGKQFSKKAFPEYVLENDKGSSGGATAGAINALTVSYYSQLVNAGYETGGFTEEGAYKISVMAGAVMIDGVPNPATDLYYYIGDASGVEALEADSDTEIYNLSGVKVGNDFNALPKGIYIIKGRKILK